MDRRKFQELRIALFINSYGGFLLKRKLLADHQNNPNLAKTEITLLANGLNLNKELLRESIFKDKCFRRFLEPDRFLFPKDKIEILIFLAIEREIINISEKGLIESLLEVDDYHGAVLQTAVERAVGNKLFDVDDDNEFSAKLLELEKSYLRCYYRVAYRYKLPTIRILPFILRLISP